MPEALTNPATRIERSLENSCSAVDRFSVGADGAVVQATRLRIVAIGRSSVADIELDSSLNCFLG